VIRWNGAPLETKFVVDSLLGTLVPSTLIQTAETANITVTDGGKTSTPATFTVFGEPDNPWTPILDSQAVTFGQVNPLNPDSVVSDWQEGIVFVNQKRLRDEGITGYIQVLEFGDSPQEANWVVQNYPITGPNALLGNSAPYTFATPPSGPLASTLVAVVNTPRPVRPVPPVPPRKPVVPPQKVMPQAHPIHLIPTAIGGIQIPPPTNVPQPDKIKPVDPALKRTDSQESLTEANSVEQAPKECAPAAVANSMEYLGVKDKLENVPSANKDPKSRVGALDTAMGYTANGTSTLGMLQGKKNYIQQKGLNLVTESQGRFCPTADPRCPGGQNGSNGAKPTEDFITKALMDKKDVEICFSWPAKPPSPAGAHCVFVTGYRFVNGYLTLDITQDLDQNKNPGGTDWEDGGHMALRVGVFNGQLWIRNWFGQAAQLTHVVTEGPK
jgi:hypothetical protein